MMSCCFFFHATYLVGNSVQKFKFYFALVALDPSSWRKCAPGMAFLPAKHLALLTWA